MNEFSNHSPNRHNLQPSSQEDRDYPIFLDDIHKIRQQVGEYAAQRAAGQNAARKPYVDAACASVSAAFRRAMEESGARPVDNSVEKPPVIYGSEADITQKNGTVEPVTEPIPIQSVASEAPADDALAAAEAHLGQVRQERAEVPTVEPSEPTVEIPIEQPVEPVQDEQEHPVEQLPKVKAPQEPEGQETREAIKTRLADELTAVMERIQNAESSQKGSVSEAGNLVNSLLGRFIMMPPQEANRYLTEIFKEIQNVTSAEQYKQRCMADTIGLLYKAAKSEAADEELRDNLGRGAKALYAATPDRDKQTGMSAEDRSRAVQQDIRKLLENPQRDANEYRHQLIAIRDKLAGMHQNSRKPSALMQHLQTLHSHMK